MGLEEGDSVQLWMQPTGGELPYEPWLFYGNNLANIGSFLMGTNCYGYMSGQYRRGWYNPFTNEWTEYGPQPGDLSGQASVDDAKIRKVIGREFEWDKDEFVDIVSADLDSVGLDFIEIDRSSEISGNGYRVALVFSDGDYHWYRQNPDGSWSHKPGNTPVSNVDAARNRIWDPENCDLGDYTFYGYYAVIPQ